MENNIWMTIIISIGIILMILFLVYKLYGKKMLYGQSDTESDIYNDRDAIHGSTFTLPFTIVDIQKDRFLEDISTPTLQSGEKIRLEAESPKGDSPVRIKVLTMDGELIGYVNDVVSKSLIHKMNQIIEAKLEGGSSDNLESIEADVTIRIQ